MRGTVAKKLRRIAQDTATQVYDRNPIAKLRKVRRHGWIEAPQAWRRKAYQLICLGIRRKYLDLKKAYKDTLDLITKRPKLSQSDHMAMVGRVDVRRAELSRGATRRRRELIRRATA